MHRRLNLATRAGGVAIAAVAALTLAGIGTIAADHLDPPSRTDPAQDSTPDRAADIADLYAWHTATDFNIVLTFAGPQATTEPATYDPDVLYTINVSNADPRVSADFPIYIRFAEGAGANEYGVQVMGIPGVSGPIEGSVERTLFSQGARVRAGLFDDPFFFDLQGFMETKQTGDLSFDSNRDFFAGQNLTAVVLSFPRRNVENMGHLVDVWATTSRLGGQL